MRKGQRKDAQLRDVSITRGYLKYAEGSALIEMGDTRVLCAASVEEGVPAWLKGAQQGWVTAEYSLLPRSTHHRSMREAARGRIGGRTYEIQRFIGRALRSVVDLKALGERTLWIDCDVLQADGGTRTAAVTGGFVALADALEYLVAQNLIQQLPLLDYVAAISAGLFNGVPMLDLSFEEDAAADVDMNVVMTGQQKLVEIQGTAEGKTFTKKELDALLEMVSSGIEELIQKQKEALGSPLDFPHFWGSEGRDAGEGVPNVLVLATHNEGKVKELREMLSSLPVEVRSLKDYPDVGPVEEKGDTFKDNAVLKAEAVTHLTGEMALADDSGLEVDHLGGSPGVYSARFAGEEATDEDNNTKLLHLMEDVPFSRRGARFVCAMALSVPGSETITVEESCEGTLSTAPRGSGGFGYDPLFICKEEGKTFAELDPETKNRISHRGKALRRMKAMLEGLFR